MPGNDDTTTIAAGNAGNRSPAINHQNSAAARNNARRANRHRALSLLINSYLAQQSPTSSTAN